LNTAPFLITLTGADNRLPTTTSLVFGGTPAGSPAGTFNKSTTLALGGISQEVAGLSTANSPATAGGYRIAGASATASTLVVNNPGAVSFDGVIGGSGTNENNLGLIKNGAGVLTLTATNTYTGATAVSAGSLIINGNQSAATGAVGVANSSTRLMGTGTVGGATTINAAAIHSAGSATGAVGNQNFSSSLSYANGSIFEWDINADSTASGFDTVAVTGALNGSTGGDTSIFRVVFGTTAKAGVNDSGNAFWNTPSTSQEWSMTSLFGKNFTSGLFTSVQTYDSGGFFDVSSKGAFTITGSSLTWTAVPEPSSALAGILLGCGLLRRRRA
jgi:autotransporter-associated beta strand protein